MPGRSPPVSALDLLAQALSPEALGGDVQPGGAASRGIVEALATPAAEILQRPGKRFRGRLVEATWELAGADWEPPAPLPVLIELLHAGSLVVDDIEDGSSHRRGEPSLHRKIGLPLALNTGNWLYFWPLELVGTLELEPDVELALHRRMARALYRAHVGQALDLGTCASEVPQHEAPGLATTIARLKTGELMALAATLAPVVARAPAACTRSLESFGMRLGTALQMFDDLGGLVGRRDPHKRHEDLRLGRVTFAWARLAERLAPPDFAALQEQAKRVQAGDEEAEPLADRIRRALGSDPCAPARTQLADAFSDLAEALGPHPGLATLAAEIRKLESSYV